MKIQNVVLAGGGVLGSQIAFQAAYSGKDVTMWLRSEGSVERAKPKIDNLYKTYTALIESLRDQDIKAASAYGGIIAGETEITGEVIDRLKAKAELAYKNIKMIVDMDEAMKDADLVIEAVAEEPAAKVDFYKTLAPKLPEKTIVVTNSSTLLPSMFAEATGRPEKYLGLHFLNMIWENNIAEVMGHEGSSEEAVSSVLQFAEEIHMVPLQLNKEQPGYIFNSMLVPFLHAAETLWAKGVADPRTIDRTWKATTGSKQGPFEILDMVGLVTNLNIMMMSPDIGDPNSISNKIADKLRVMIDEGKTGLAAGEGFYKYK